MTMPVMEPDLGAAVLRDWARAIDDGPFASLCWGERVTFDNPDTLTLLGALAAWTDRVRLVTTVIVPQLHDPVMLAKALATGDVLSGGRLTVGVGVGGRTEDYHAVGADLATQTIPGMAERVAVMKRVWAGEQITESVLPVGPAPVQAGGPPLLVGTIGPKTVRSASAWADGLAGTTLDLDVAKQNELFDVARAAWAEAGKPKPHLATSFWFALGSPDDARQQVHRHLLRYMNWIPPEYVDAMAPTTGFAG
ncbi:MAG: LLM class flavin-dependent oxidoreductase, partial [Mycobacterium sp.]